MFFSCPRSGMGGLINANHFMDEPFDAALIALAPLWQKANPNEVEHFMSKWEQSLRREHGTAVDVQTYIAELKDLISRLLPPVEMCISKDELIG